MAFFPNYNNLFTLYDKFFTIFFILLAALLHFLVFTVLCALFHSAQATVRKLPEDMDMDIAKAISSAI